ncbi:MAG: tetratricopeptide repeat protein, partial [Chloroflexota bacterium]|nr:tetratricopeptide repeat protein [Chloroflexota bacterium]
MRRFANWVRRWPASLRAGWMANRVRAGFALTILLLIVLINLAVFDPEATALIGRVWIVLLEAGALALLIGLLLWRWRQRDTVSVLPFQNLTGDESFAGVSAGFADLLTAEIQRIINLHEQTEWLGHRRQAPIPLREKSLPSRLGEATLSPIGASGGDLGETLENIGAVGVGPLNIPLGSLLAFVLRLFQPGTISGNFQMHDETLSIVVNLKARNRPTEKWVVKGKLGPNSTTVRELASELAYMMINDTSPSIARTVWQSFKAFSNGLEQYRSFLLSGGLDRQALDEARRHYETAVALEPSFALAHYNLGVVYEESGMPEATIEAYKQALSLDPRLAQAYHSLGLVHLNQNRLSEAVEALEQAVELDPTRPRFRQSLAVALSEAAVSSIELETERRIEFLEWATSLYEQAITGYRQIQADRDVRSEEEERLPPTDEAARWIRDNQAAAWRELGRTWLNLAHLYDQYEQEEPVIQALQQAQSAFLAALALNDRDADSWVVLGDLHHQLDNHEQAVAYFRKSLAIAPMGISAVDAHLGLGEVYLRHSDDILQYLEEAKAEEATREALPVWELDLAGKEFLDQAVAEFRAALDLHFAHWEWAVIEEGSGEMRHQAPPRAWELLDQLAAALLVPSALEDQNEAHSFTEFLALKPGEDALTPPLSELQAERNEAASRVLKWALALNPELPQVHDGLAALYELVGADEAAPAHVWLRDHCSTTDYPEVLLQVLEGKVNQTPEGDSSRGIYL